MRPFLLVCAPVNDCVSYEPRADRQLPSQRPENGRLSCFLTHSSHLYRQLDHVHHKLLQLHTGKWSRHSITQSHKQPLITNPQRFCPSAKQVAPKRALAANLARRQPCAFNPDSNSEGAEATTATAVSTSTTTATYYHCYYYSHY